ncbi:hypothetical protein C0J50_6966 [Silurus asotus]|uniref:Uncharacterized protein n=1 Tax=Silurus asotus TaxID=30991 RepID=A0AAD5F8P9_SILAS|nr:hypothetical protein C0J50_6966 [Silurus asotus]
MTLAAEIMLGEHREDHLDLPNNRALNTLHPEHDRKEYTRHHKKPPPSINGSIQCHACLPEQRAGEEKKNDVQEATVHVPVETKRLPVATIPTDAEDWSSE